MPKDGCPECGGGVAAGDDMQETLSSFGWTNKYHDLVIDEVSHG